MAARVSFGALSGCHPGASGLQVETSLTAKTTRMEASAKVEAKRAEYGLEEESLTKRLEELQAKKELESMVHTQTVEFLKQQQEVSVLAQEGNLPVNPLPAIRSPCFASCLWFGAAGILWFSRNWGIRCRAGRSGMQRTFRT